MAINITCPGCHTRFKVSDQYAGKEGPCPKCKTKIKIPGKSDEVVIHAPEEYEGLKDSSGQSVLKPISRKEAKLSPQLIIGIVGGVLMLLLVAFIVGRACRQDGVPVFLLGVGAVLLAPALVFGGYTFLRDDELQPHRGMSLWVRVGICSAVYAALWAVYAIVVYSLLPHDNPAVWHLVVIVPAMFLAGAGVANVSLDLEFTSGLFHYGMYLAATVLLRLVMGLHAFGGFAGS
jgi:predicted Zn finger-like uncharacterized protein